MVGFLLLEEEGWYCFDIEEEEGCFELLVENGLMFGMPDGSSVHRDGVRSKKVSTCASGSQRIENTVSSLKIWLSKSPITKR